MRSVTYVQFASAIQPMGIRDKLWCDSRNISLPNKNSFRLVGPVASVLAIRGD